MLSATKHLDPVTEILHFAPVSAIQLHFSAYSDINKIEDKSSTKQWKGLSQYEHSSR